MHRLTPEQLVEARGPSIKPALRRKVNKEIEAITKGGAPIPAIPLDDFAKMLAKHDLVMVQEDGTEWSGMLLGREGSARISVAPNVYQTVRGMKVYTPFSNTLLYMTWHKFDTGRYEVIARLT